MVTKPKTWTRDRVAEETRGAVEFFESDPSKCLLVEYAVTRPWSRNRWAEWRTQYADDEEIACAIKKVDDICMMRLLVGGLQGKLDRTMVIFITANNHGLSRTDQSQNNDGKPIERPPASKFTRHKGTKGRGDDRAK